MPESLQRFCRRVLILCADSPRRSRTSRIAQLPRVAVPIETSAPAANATISSTEQHSFSWGQHFREGLLRPKLAVRRAYTHSAAEPVVEIIDELAILPGRW